MAAGAVEAVGADAAFGQADTLHKGIYLAEFKAREPEASGDLVDHPAVFGSRGI